MNRDFKGVWIPKEIWLDHNLTWMEKLFITEIHSLDKENGCFAGNKYFAKFFNLSEHRCSQIINSLIKKKYLSVFYERRGLEIVKRVLRICHEGIKEMSIRCLENVIENNTINNTVNNTKERIPPSLDELKQYFSDNKITEFTPEAFYDFYESKNWMIGKNKMKSWQHAIGTWKHRTKQQKQDNIKWYYNGTTEDGRKIFFNKDNPKEVRYE